MKNEWKKKTLELIGKGLVKKALDYLRTHIDSGEYEVALIVLTSRYQSIRRSNYLGKLTQEELNAQINKLSSDFLSLIEDIELDNSISIIDDDHIIVTGNPPFVVIKGFQDRYEIREKIYSALNNDDVRFVSIVGRGGIGKTAVILKLLNEIIERERDVPKSLFPLKGIYFIDTEELPDIHKIFQGISYFFSGLHRKEIEQLAVKNIPIDNKLRELNQHIGGEKIIIILDQLEKQLTPRGNFVFPEIKKMLLYLLQNVKGVTILTTTRVPVDLGLDMLKGFKEYILNEGLPAQESISYLRYLDQQTNKERQRLSKKSEAELFEVANIVNGWPRALEYVNYLFNHSSRRNFTNVEKFRKAFTGNDDIMSKLVDEAYVEFGEDSKRVLEALSVFQIDVEQEAIEFLLEPFYSNIDFDDIIDVLWRNHIVKIDDETGLIRLHSFDSERFYQKIPDEGRNSKQNLELRASIYYENRINMNGNVRALDNEQIDSFLMRFKHLVLAKDYEKAAEIINSEIGIWLVWQGYSDRILLLLKQLENNLHTEKSKANYYCGLGNVKSCLGPLDEALELLDKAEALAENLDETPLLGDIFINKCFVYRVLGDLENSRIFGVKSLECYNAPSAPLFQKIRNKNSNRITQPGYPGAPP